MCPGRIGLLSTFLSAAAATMLGQAPPAPEPTPPPAPATALPNASASPAAVPATTIPNASASPMSALPSTSQMLENIGKLVKDGHLSVEADLIQGRMPVIPKYTLDVEGSPKTSVLVEAADGKVTHMKFGVEN